MCWLHQNSHQWPRYVYQSSWPVLSIRHWWRLLFSLGTDVNGDSFLSWIKSVPVLTDGNYSYPRDLRQGSDKYRSISSTHWQSYWLRFPCSPWGQSRQCWKSEGNVSTIFWQVSSLIQIANGSTKWVFMGRTKPVRRKSGAWTKSDRCTGEIRIQKLCLCSS